MAIKKYKSTTSGRRNMTSFDFAEITTPTPERSLLQPLKNNAGRNNNGRITVCRQDGDHKRQYHMIDFKRNKDGVATVIKAIKYDPSRSASIALVHYEDGIKAHILAPKGLEVGIRPVSGPEADIKVGNALPLENIPVGTVVRNIEMRPGKSGQLIRSARTSAQVLSKEGRHVLIHLNSGEVRMILTTCRTAIGSIGNGRHELTNIGEASRSRWMRKHPTIRDSIVNPNDHPHGGGEDKTPIGHEAPVSPWGQPVIRYRTRSKKAKSDKLIARHRTK